MINWSALANSNEGNIVTNTGYNGGRGRGANRGGGHGGGNRDKLYCTHCGRYLNGMPRNVPATPAEIEHPNDNTEQKTCNQHWKVELSVLRQRLAALEGATQDSSIGMTSSHNHVAFASSTSSSTWVIDSSATDHVTSVCSEFLSYTSNLEGG